MEEFLNLQKLQSAYLEKLHPNLSLTMQKMQKLAKEEKIPIIGDEVGRLLCLLCSLKKPKKILELGTGISYSTHWMLLQNQEVNITSIDQNQDRIYFAKKFLSESGFLENVKLLPIWIKDFFLTNQEKFDIIFLDSQKSLYQNMFSDILVRLKKNALLIVDNSLYKKQVCLEKKKVKKEYRNAVFSIQAFNQLVFQSSELKSFLFSLGDGVLVAKKI